MSTEPAAALDASSASPDTPEGNALPNAAQLRQRFRIHTLNELYDDSSTQPGGLAIYTLSDPRDIRDVRYVGQTRAPRRRFLIRSRKIT